LDLSYFCVQSDEKSITRKTIRFVVKKRQIHGIKELTMATEPCLMTLSEATRRIRNNDLSPIELLESCLKMIDRLDPTIKAWVTLDREGASRQASALAQQARDGDLRGVLHGIPIGLKDIFYTAGMRTTAGHSAMADFVPEYDSAVAERLRRAGAIILGKTATTEFALMAPAPTRNPWNPEHTPGGSSSGSGAAVAARMCPAAIGSQTGGSTIRPAAYCGVVGFKPTFGRISAFGMIPLAYSTDHPGIIAREVNDLTLMLQALAGYDPRDHTSAMMPVGDYLKEVEAPVRQPTIALMAGDFIEKASDEIAANVRAAADRLARAGARVEEIAPPPTFNEVGKAFWNILTTEPAAYHREALEKRPETFDPKTLEFLKKGLTTPAVTYLHSLQVQRRFRHEIVVILQRYDAILVPSTNFTAPKGLDSTGDPVFNNPWSMTGNPVVGLPSGLSNQGLPMAVQLVGAAFAKGRLLALARWCEKELGFKETPRLN
jgi:aspartyl-tRNA(Asn)/glutamyl-tRNA(Gln) amidotransferase subunit A